MTLEELEKMTNACNNGFVETIMPPTLRLNLPTIIIGMHSGKPSILLKCALMRIWKEYVSQLERLKKVNERLNKQL